MKTGAAHRRMSALGQKQTFSDVKAMSALLPKADILPRYHPLVLSDGALHPLVLSDGGLNVLGN